MNEMSTVDRDSEMCVDCDENVVFFYRSYFCEDCIRDFFNKNKTKEGAKVNEHGEIV